MTLTLRLGAVDTRSFTRLAASPVTAVRFGGERPVPPGVVVVSITLGRC